MQLDESEVNTMWLALKTAIQHQENLANIANDKTFIREDYNQLLVNIEKWQKKQSKKPKIINLGF